MTKRESRPRRQRAGGRPGRGRPRSARRFSRQPLDPELRARAVDIAERSGIPLGEAYRVARGQASLNDVLQQLLRRERLRRLVEREGMDPSLAGQVVSGDLSLARARLLQDLRAAGRSRFTEDRIAAAGKRGGRVAIWTFEDGWLVGTVQKARTYDFDFLRTGAEEAALVHKHDVKALAAPEAVPAIQERIQRIKAIAQLGLGASSNKEDRYHPTESELVRLRETRRNVLWVFRDGTTVLGKVVAFGRWDADVELTGGTAVTVFFHALHAETGARLGRVA